MVPWEIHGLGFGNCNCDYGCPCQFESKPTNGGCEGIEFVSIDKGHFGDVPLGGLKLGAIYAWPGSIPEGKGRCQIFIDENADDAQRDALLRISRGEEAKTFSNVFYVYTAMCDDIYDPIFTKIDFEMDMEKRTARCVAHGVAENSGEPIIGVTGDAHRVQIAMPKGIEFRLAEVGRGRCRTQGEIELELDDGYAQFHEVHLNQNGVIDHG